jgi:predicted DNA-binding transcriptional regulator AlpA
MQAMTIMENVDDKGETLRAMMTAEEIIERIPVSRAMLFRLEADGLFPQGQPITQNRKLWFRDEVVAWQRALADPESELSKAVRQRIKPHPRRGKAK